MTPKPYASRCFLIAVLAFAMPAVATNIDFVEDTPYAHFTDEDRTIYDETRNDTLNNEADGASRTWSNPDTRAGGELKVLKTFERNGLTCRTLHIANTADDLSASGKYTFCKTASGQWKVAN